MIIYKHTFKSTKESYIGYSTNSIEHRLAQHIHNADKGSETHFHRAIRKYGIEDLESEVLEFTSEVINREKYWIKHYNTFLGNGYNMTEGGEGGNTRAKMSEEEKLAYNKKISLGNKGRKLTTETKEKMSKAKTLNPTSLIGKDNGRALLVKVYNSKGELMFSTKGRFKLFCKENNLPYTGLMNSYKSGGEPFIAHQKKHFVYDRWYCIVDKINQEKWKNIKYQVIDNTNQIVHNIYETESIRTFLNKFTYLPKSISDTTEANRLYENSNKNTQIRISKDGRDKFKGWFIKTL